MASKNMFYGKQIRKTNNCQNATIGLELISSLEKNDIPAPAEFCNPTQECIRTFQQQ